MFGVLCLSECTGSFFLFCPDKAMQKSTPFLSVFIEKYPRRQIFHPHVSLFDARLFRNVSPRSCPVMLSLCGEAAVGETNRGTQSEIAWLRLETQCISVIRSLYISSHLMSVRRLKWWIAATPLSAACGRLKASAGRIWKIANANGKALLASRASALSSVKLLSKIHSEIAGTDRYCSSWRTCGVIQRAWWTGIADSSTSVKRD